MPSDCIFCRIVKGEIPCYKIYEDRNFLAFLDINPINKGHVLVLSKEHYKNIFEIPDEKLSEIIVLIKKLLKTLNKAGFGEEYNIIQNNGKTAGQDIFHIHFHLIPRIKDDHSINPKWIEKPSDKEMQKIAEKIRNSL